ncbi:hypothetical protein DLM75_06420 [Leptospira stimsonii]|uniref:Uncharacterized protein n=1 Tax=Leptospira stimsonii TaxID=2202203 RepID=A0A396ZGC8_9LEPT|nr:hypothetical protein DLM75_06420 [Leptospira stimsonii]
MGKIGTYPFEIIFLIRFTFKNVLNTKSVFEKNKIGRIKGQLHSKKKIGIPFSILRYLFFFLKTSMDRQSSP